MGWRGNARGLTQGSQAGGSGSTDSSARAVWFELFTLKSSGSLLQNWARRKGQLRFIIVIVGISKTLAITIRFPVGRLHG